MIARSHRIGVNILTSKDVFIFIVVLPPNPSGFIPCMRLFWKLLGIIDGSKKMEDFGTLRMKYRKRKMVLRKT